MSRRIEIRWGQFKEGYSFGSASTSHTNKKWHLIVPEPYDYTAVCGKNCYGTKEFTHGGYVCPDCAKAIGLKSATDFDVLEDEYEWGLAQWPVTLT